MISWDNTVRLGVWPFSVTLSETHPFYPIVRQHDFDYSTIAFGAANFTLKEADRNFLKNGLFAAMGYELWIDRILIAKQVWIAYRACRAWAKYVRPELERWKPGDPAPIIMLTKEQEL